MFYSKQMRSVCYKLSILLCASPEVYPVIYEFIIFMNLLYSWFVAFVENPI